MRLGCLSCWIAKNLFTPAPMRRDPWGWPYKALCDDCNEHGLSTIHEREFVAHHGSDVPVSDAERGALLLKEGRA